MNRLLTLLFALGLFAGHASGQTTGIPADSASAEYTFRFVADDDMFYIPWSGNGEELDRLLACIAENRTAITDGTVPVLVDGYCTSQATAAENLAMAKTRSNRVKTEMILRGGLTEDCFTTQNHAANGNFVTVRIIIPAAKPSEAEKPAETVQPAEPQPAKTEAEPAEPLPTVLEQPAPETTETAEAEGEAPQAAESGCSNLSLRANLLRWATLTPDLGMEWRISPSWGIAVNGSWTSWTMSDNNFRYAFWEVMPEVRWYLGEKRAWYVGAMFKTGQFDYKLTKTGKQGDLTGGGITGGYQLRVNKSLNIDFSLGLGYLNADYEKYEVIDGVRVSQGTKTEGWWGPINAGISLVWKLF